MFYSLVFLNDTKIEFNIIFVLWLFIARIFNADAYILVQVRFLQQST